MPKETLGKSIKQARLKYHLSQEKLAEKLGVSVMSISRWEHDKAIPHYDLRRGLIEVLQIDPDLFTQLKEEETGSERSVSRSDQGAPDRQSVLPAGGEAQAEEEFVEIIIPPLPKVYRGWRSVEPEGRFPTTHVTVDGKTLRYFNTDGPRRKYITPETRKVYEWGYEGAGPGQLATSLLASYFDIPPPPGWASREEYPFLKEVSDFKWDFVAHFPYYEWVLPSEVIAAWLDAGDEERRWEVVVAWFRTQKDHTPHYLAVVQQRREREMERVQREFIDRGNKEVRRRNIFAWNMFRLPQILRGRVDEA